MAVKNAAISWKPSASLRARIEALADSQGVALTKVITELVERGLSITDGGSIKVSAVRGSKVKTNGKRERTTMCEHRRPADQYCARCDG